MTGLHGAALVLLVNMVSFALFGIDKGRARRGMRRIRERDLLGMALLGGSPGAFAGRHIFRHKTRKQPFSTWLHVIAMVQVASLVGWFLI